MANETILTFADIQNRVLRWVDESTDTTTTLNLVKDAINASHRRVISSQQWPFMAWPVDGSLTTVSGTRLYALHPNADRVYHLWDTTLQQYFPIIPRREWPAVGANQSSVGAYPFGMTLGPNWPVQYQPGTAQAIKVVSSSSSDVTPLTVILIGIDSTGARATETLTLTGTSVVTSTGTFSYLTNVTKTGTWAGTLTISAGSTTLLTLPASTPGRWYPTVEFLEDPITGRTYTYAFQRQPMILTQDNDLPEIPYPYSEILVYDALIDLSTYNTELGIKEQSVWGKRYDSLWGSLTAAYDNSIVGSYPKFVRDLDESVIRSRTGVYNP